ncbi:tetratricopeptide repeat protein [Desulfobulbus sp. F5]|nr:tetratricopeptide repeat protein [Desulfobulbus sp. F5]
MPPSSSFLLPHFLRKLPPVLLATLVFSFTNGCAHKKKPAPPPLVPPKQAAVIKPAPTVKAVPVIGESSTKSKNIAMPVPPKDESDHGCSYFYFLWGRHAELETKYEAALEAYEKALICDPDADFVISKLPLLLLRMDRRDEAAIKLKEYLARHPEDTASRMLLAKVFISDGKLAEAAEQYRKAHELNPKDTTPLLLLSELHLAENKQEQAKAALENVLAVDRSSHAAHLLLARLLAAEEKFASALDHYQQAIAITPSGGVQLEMADLLVRQKKYRQAVKMYQALLVENEDNEEARIALIHVYLTQNKEKKAMAELKRLKDLANNPEQNDLTIIKLCIRWEEYAKAMSLLQDLLKKEEMPEARYLLGALQFQEKQYEDALKTLEKISPEDEEYEDGLILQVRTLKELKQQEQAIQLLQSALEGEQQLGPDMYVLLASLYQTAEQDEAVKKTYDRALKAHPGNEHLLYEYGLFLDYSGKKKQALSAMQKLLKKNSDHVGALNYVGYAWADAKVNLNKAFLYLSRAKELKPADGYIQDSLGWVYYRLGNFEEARKTLETAARLTPDDAAVFDHLAEVYLAAGRKDEALKAWQKALDLHAKKPTEGEKNKKQQEREYRERQRLEEKIDRLTHKEKQ